MNQGKRYIRNTVFALCGAAALFVGLNRLYVATTDAGAPAWMRSALSLGLRTISPPEPTPDLDLASLRDFTQLSVSGDFTVEVVGAPQYKVTFTPSADGATKVRATQKGGMLRLQALGDRSAAAPAMLRIEVPTLTRVYVTRVSQLTLRGLQAQELSVFANKVAVARLQQNQVARWKLLSAAPLELQVDNATLAAGSLQATGVLTIRHRE